MRLLATQSRLAFEKRDLSDSSPGTKAAPAFGYTENSSVRSSVIGSDIDFRKTDGSATSFREAGRASDPMSWTVALQVAGTLRAHLGAGKRKFGLWGANVAPGLTRRAHRRRSGELWEPDDFSRHFCWRLKSRRYRWRAWRVPLTATALVLPRSSKSKARCARCGRSASAIAK